MQTFPLVDTPDDFGKVVPVTIVITKPYGTTSMFAKIAQSELGDGE